MQRQKPVAAKKAIRGAKLALLKIEHGVHLLQQVKSGDRRQEEQEGERLQLKSRPLLLKLHLKQLPLSTTRKFWRYPKKQDRWNDKVVRLKELIADK